MMDDTNEQAAPAETQSETLIERIEHAAADAVHAIEDAAKAAVHEAEHALGLDAQAPAAEAAQEPEAEAPTADAAAPAPELAQAAAAEEAAPPPAPEPATPSRPQVGDSVLFWPHTGIGYQGSFPIEAEIDHVWSDTCVNVSMPASNGSEYQATSVFLVRNGQALPSGYYCAYADELPQAVPAAKVYEVAAPTLQQDLQALHDVAVEAAAEARAAAAEVQQATATYADGEGIIRIEDARALPEASPDAPSVPVVATIERHIESFVDSDGRVMRIVKVAGALAKKAVQAVEAAI